MSAFKRFRWLSSAGVLAALTLSCGGTTKTTEGDSGNTNWLKSCTTDAECGGLTCSCGSCRNECTGATLCSLEPEKACLAPQAAPEAPGPRALLQHTNPEAHAYDMARAQDGSIVLVGGAERAVVDFAITYPEFWLGKLDAEANVLWEYQEPPAGENVASNTGIGLAVTASGEIVTVSTIYDGLDTPSLRRFDEQGTLLETWSSSPGFTRLRSAPGGDLFAAGSRLLEWRAGRPFTSAWIGRLGAADNVWQHERQGVDGSISGVETIDANAAGELVVAGFLGSASDSNASVPWLARLNAQGELVWQRSIEVATAAHCTAGLAAFTPSGDSLATTTNCSEPWLRAYDPTGAVLWERRFERAVTAVAALADGGYAVALGTRESSSQEQPPDAELLRFDDQHRLLWRAKQPDCSLFERLLLTEEGVLALAGCHDGLVVTEYADP